MLAGCSKKTLLFTDNMVNEFHFVDNDNDNEINIQDIRKFLKGFSTEETSIWDDTGKIAAMIAHINSEYRPEK